MGYPFYPFFTLAVDSSSKGAVSSLARTDQHHLSGHPVVLPHFPSCPSSLVFACCAHLPLLLLEPIFLFLLSPQKNPVACPAPSSTFPQGAPHSLRRPDVHPCSEHVFHPSVPRQGSQYYPGTSCVVLVPLLPWARTALSHKLHWQPGAIQAKTQCWAWAAAEETSPDQHLLMALGLTM